VVRRLTARLLAAIVLLTSPAWVHGALTQAPAMETWWNASMFVLVGLTALDVLVAGAVGVLVRGPAVGLAAAAALAVITWPAGVVDEAAAATRLPWLWLLLPTALAAVATLDSLAVSLGYGSTVAAVFVSYRTLDVGGDGPFGVVVLEGLLLVVMGVGLALLVRTARTAARRVDEDAARAAAASAAAAALAAAAAARADVDAVLHDRVLAALALVAGSPASPRVPESARRALDALGAPPADPAGAGPADPVALTGLAVRVAAAVATLSPGARVAGPVTGHDGSQGTDADDRRDGATAVPEPVARAVIEAAAEAVRNSVRHGRPDGSAPMVTVGVHSGQAPGSVRVEIRDDGRGFRPDAVPPGRLGLQVSVFGRMRAVGGRAEVASGPGQGTTVVLSWPADADGDEPGRAT
jgi:hypothetical protein